MKSLLGIAMLLTLSTFVSAQKISPLEAEYGRGKASGEFYVENLSLSPMAVTIEPKGFAMNANGKMDTFDLKDVKFKLSEMSMKLGPLEKHTVYYDVACPSTPCHLAFYARFVPAKRVKLDIGDKHFEGVTIAVHLPYVIYVCEKAKNCEVETKEAMRKSVGLN